LSSWSPDEMNQPQVCRWLQCFLLFLHLALVFPVVRVNRLLKRKSLDHKRLCVCAINIISCSNLHLENVTLNLPNHTSVLDLSFNNITKLLATWTLTDLNMLQTMLLNNNRLTFLSSEAFVHVKKLRYLDLSYNGLTLLDEFIFEPLEDLEVLVLFKNHISKIDRTAFSSMGALQKLYMSHNQISRIPLEVLKERSKLDTFKLLDVSFNKIKDLPIKELQSMRAWMKNGVYFHNNPLTCSCELYKLVASWDIRMLSSVSGFADNHTCTMPDKKTKEILNITCNDDKILIREANLEQKLLLDCDTRQKYMEKRWVLPGNISLTGLLRVSKTQMERDILLGNTVGPQWTGELEPLQGRSQLSVQGPWEKRQTLVYCKRGTHVWQGAWLFLGSSLWG
uniref:Adhesion molecule with Ig like domain 1 n=1 Tax=Cyprinodon variegatus TaxID=28743 RepID=A0A3Q2CDC6_CYPVA